ncbi:unnamed protein product, partial [Prorocentrum cordatum]
YVGAGAGNVALVPIPGPGCSSCWWLLCLLWLFIIPFCLPSTTTTTSTTVGAALARSAPPTRVVSSRRRTSPMCM